jgi:dolichol-phosphate mannosyltransferase
MTSSVENNKGKANHPTDTPKILAIIATYNEKENICALIERLLSLPLDLCVLIVDDNSPDGTPDAISASFSTNSRVNLIVRDTDKGYGKAMIAGMQWALAKDFDTIVTLDADFSHDPKSIPSLVEATGNHDVAIGSRYIHGVRVSNWRFSRLLISMLANWYVRTILGMRIVDCTSGFRAYRAHVFRGVDLSGIRSSGYSFLVELLYTLYRRKFGITEVPITYWERREGQSKMSKRIILEAVWRPVFLRLRSLVGKS